MTTLWYEVLKYIELHHLQLGMHACRLCILIQNTLLNNHIYHADKQRLKFGVLSLNHNF